jgi:hypothetical protein
MSLVAPLAALAGVVIGAVLSYVFTYFGERRREEWALDREWRERMLEACTAYLADVKRMRDIAQRIAADVGLDGQAPALPRDSGIDLLAEANMARSRSFETVALITGAETVDAARELNRVTWRLEWFARGLLDDADVAGWEDAVRRYHRAMNAFHLCVRRELGINSEFSPRRPEHSPREQWESDRRRSNP